MNKNDALSAHENTLQGWTNDNFVNQKKDASLSGVFQAWELKSLNGLKIIHPAAELGNTNYTTYSMISFYDKNETVAGFVYGTYTPQSTFEIRQRTVNADDTSKYTETALSYDGYARFEVPVIPIDTTFERSAISLGYLNNIGNNIVHKTGNEEIKGDKFFSHLLARNTGVNTWIDIIHGWPDENNTEGVRYSGIRFYKGDAQVQSVRYVEYGTVSSLLKETQFLGVSGSFRNGFYRNIVDNKYIGFSYISAANMSVNDGTFLDSEVVTLKSGAFFSDNVISLGTGDRKWGDIYSTNGTIQTSDERLKTEIQAIPEDVLQAWGECNFSQFKFKDAVAEKGTNARIHFGGIAQEFKQKLEAKGIDPTRYGFFCYDSWEDQYEDKEILVSPEVREQVKVVDSQAVYDIIRKDDGTEEQVLVSPEKSHMEEQVTKEAVYRTEKTLKKAAGNQYSLRYEELLVLEAAYQRWALKKIAEKVGVAI